MNYVHLIEGRYLLVKIDYYNKLVELYVHLQTETNIPL